ncbi:AI-2E family transporter [Roseimicrobium sp. ORNL1]|uniref:AI-2E family transporter n=1 Tax=Roseimicrobium sp. ORNL1 TaxID=2711231 RepID=UPI0013E1F43B|nr:AI-2E family transporter [Roseimicrobium sp. ORNL1]QIF03940.1 AI-2E family transporter [Roseimicrobium sp. ORNL1]
MAALEDQDDIDRESLAPRGAMQGMRALITLACAVVVIAGLKAGASFFAPLVVAFFLAVLSYPLMAWLMRKKVPHVVALFITVGVIVLCIGLLGWAGYGLLKSLSQEVPRYLLKLKSIVEETAVWLEKDVGVDGAIKGVEQFNLQYLVEMGTQKDVMQQLAAFAGSTFGTVAFFLGAHIVVLVVMMFTLMEAPGTRNRAEVVRAAGGPDFSLLMQSATDIQKYLGVKTLISAATGVLAFAWCWMFDLKYPLLWGILAFLFNYVPAVGSTVASVPAIIEALVNHGVGSAVGVGIGYAIINFGLDNFLQPMLMGRKFGISGLVIVLSVLFWGWVWGPIGMFLAVPLTMMMKVILENTNEFRWISVAMAKKKVKHGEVVLETPEFADAELLGGGAATEPPR